MSAFFYQSSSSEGSKPLDLHDVLIALGLALLASSVFWTTPQFAASLPQDASNYAIPAVNLLERGRLVVSAYGQDLPPKQPPGMPLLLLPAYILGGHFLGNGIYAIFFCAVGTVALTYLIGAKLGGRLCGCAAALFLVWNYGFWQYSHKIMSEVPTAFFGVVLLALLLTIRDRKRPGIVCLGIGGILGFAIAIRNDNILLLAPVALLVAREGARRERARRVALVLAGMAPFLIGLAVYDQLTFGSPLRTGYHYWASFWSINRPGFSAGYITKSGFLRLEGITNANSELEGNGTLYMKSLLDEADATQIFMGLPWHLGVLRLHQTLALLRDVLGIAGLLACLVAWRTNLLRQKFVLWLVGMTFVYVGFYLTYYYRDERFLLRLVPVFCLADGIGVAGLFAKWSSTPARVAMAVVVGALIRWYMLVTPGMGLPKGEPQGIYEALTWFAGDIETNAVVVSNLNPLWVDAYVIHGTHRMAVPLGREDDIPVLIGSDSTPTFLGPFVASRDPERLRELLHSGLPIYWVAYDPARKPSPELTNLGQSFRLTALPGTTFESGAAPLVFGRIDDLPPQH